MVVRIKVKVKRSGRGLARERAAIRDGLGDAVWQLTKDARLALGVRFIHVFREPTGYYESRTEAERVSQLVGRVHDNDVAYGPWLEGTGSRNYPVTRFPGYHSFQVVADTLRSTAGPVAEAHIRRRLLGVN